MTTYDTIAQDEDACHTAPLEPQVVIYLEGGNVSDMDIANGITVEVRDYSTADLTAEDRAFIANDPDRRFETDEGGNECLVTTWGGED